MLRAACAEARRWRERGLGELWMGVNVSARQFRDRGLTRQIGDSLAAHALPPAAIEIELTEMSAMEDVQRSRQVFGELRDLGVKVAIDDFGTGYSSLSYLKNLPFDKLKIDREFVTGVDQRRDHQAICRAIIELARGLSLDLLAEGTETAAEVAELERAGCRRFQGFYFGRPLSPDEFVWRIDDFDWPPARVARHEDVATMPAPLPV